MPPTMVTSRVLRRRDGVELRVGGHRVLSLLLVLPVLLAFGCARPYRGPKTLAAIGAGLLVAGSASWVAGERREAQTLTRAGMITTAVGAALAVGAAGWLAGSIGCQADPDCADDEVCREIPAPPGREPYRQCMPP